MQQAFTVQARQGLLHRHEGSAWAGDGPWGRGSVDEKFECQENAQRIMSTREEL